MGPQAEAARLFRERTALYDDGRVQHALTLWRQAWALDPENWVIRKQVWAVENPDRFNEGPMDFAWQREQREKGMQRNGRALVSPAARPLWHRQ